MKIYDTLAGKKVEFKPLNKNVVKMYVCGPTVYDLGHLGHGRSAVSFDIIRKYLVHKGYNVEYVTNFTDVDDKMIARAEIMKCTVSELADKIIPEYKKDYGDLGIMVGDKEPKATDFVEEMIDMIRVLEEKDYVYKISDGLYFDITKYEEYGKLSKQKMDELKAGARKDVNEEKRNHQDFVVWKFSKPGEPQWDSPWGMGRPGWHIECSAMCKSLLGDTIDIHGGGADLTFPHHECEIAQSESANDKQFVNYWIHNGFINVNNEKMSKSLGNFFTLRDVFKKFDPQVVRYLFLQTHYRSPIDFTDKLLEQSKNSLMRIHDFMNRLENYNGGKNAFDELINPGYLDEMQVRIEEAMNDDFETPNALAVCFTMIRDINKVMDNDEIDRNQAVEAKKFFEKIDKIFGVFIPSQEVSIGSGIEDLIQERNVAREEKNWDKADEIRDILLGKGIQLEDGDEGTVWKKI